MNWNLFWCLWCLAFAIAVWICDWAVCFRKMGREKRCYMRTVGRVVRWSAVRCGGIPIPLVEYTAEGRTYKVAGPKFQSVVISVASTPFHDPMTRYETNLTVREELPRKLRVKAYRNSLGSMEVSPLAALYPIGSPADVWYNPDKPKEAFVQRFEGVNCLLLVLLTVSGVFVTLLSLLCLVGPRILMQ